MSTKKIVVIDGDSNFGSSIITHLSKLGYDVEHVSRPCAVANTLRTFRPDIVLTDQYVVSPDGKNLPFTLRQPGSDQPGFKLLLLCSSCEAPCKEMVEDGLIDGCLDSGMPLDMLKDKLDSFC